MSVTVDEAAAYWSARPKRDPDAQHYATRWATPVEGWQPPSTNELRGLLKAAGWSQAYAGRLAGYAPRTARHWCAGDTPVPYSVWFVLRETFLNQSEG